MGTTTINLIENFCRTCMAEEKSALPQSHMTKYFVSIFGESQQTMNGDNITIIELLMQTIPRLSVASDDMLPKNICQNCVDKMLNIYEFQQKCLVVEKRLTDLVTNINGVVGDPLINEMMQHAVTDPINLECNKLDKPLPQVENVNDNVACVADENLYNEEENASSDNNEDVNNKWNSLDEIPLSKIRKIELVVVHPELANLEIPSDSQQNTSVPIFKKMCDRQRKQFACNKCGNIFKTLRSLKAHEKIHVCPKPKRKAIRKINYKKESDTEWESCQDKEIQPQGIHNQNHMLLSDFNVATSSKNLVGKEDGDLLGPQDQLPKEQVKQQENIPQENLFACDECGSRVKSRKSLKRHKRIHLRQPGEKAPPKTNKNNTKYKCEYCPKVFVQSSSLKDHLRTHTGEKPYLCSECGKAFKILSNMKQHLLRHGEDRPYECPECPKKFPCLTDLASHKAVHNKSKSHVCDICGAGFGKPYLLKKHKMYHTGEKNHKCDYCEMRFVVAEQCRRHMRIHTGEKPYICKYCERAFAQSNDLTKHLRCHLGNKVYRCTLCPQGFRLQSDLRTHFNTHKNDDEDTRLRNLQALKDDELRIQRKFGLLQTEGQ